MSSGETSTPARPRAPSHRLPPLRVSGVRCRAVRVRSLAARSIDSVSHVRSGREDNRTLTHSLIGRCYQEEEGGTWDGCESSHHHVRVAATRAQKGDECLFSSSKHLCLNRRRPEVQKLKSDWRAIGRRKGSSPLQPETIKVSSIHQVGIQSRQVKEF